MMAQDAGVDGIADELQRLRRARSWTQEDVEEHSGLTQGQISQFESGKKRPSMGSLRRLAKAFGVPVEDLARRAGYLDAVTPERDTARPIDLLIEEMVAQYPELAAQFAERQHDDDFPAQVRALAKVLGFTARGWLDRA